MDERVTKLIDESERVQRYTLTPAELAQRLGTSTPSVYRLLETIPSLPRLNIGRRILIPIVPFERWLDEYTRKGAQ